MKGGKGGQGRKRSTTKTVEKVKPQASVKRGAPKRDWGPIAKDDGVPAARSDGKGPRSA